jgi:glycerophosphoryl diester phosphodiesterase
MSFTCNTAGLTFAHFNEAITGRVFHMLGSSLALVLITAVPPATPAKLVVAHRGASGYVPEHSQMAYELALSQQADVIELDLVVSKDQQLLIRHENELSLSTDVADRPEFAKRKTSKIIDGLTVSGWFAEDFTIAELTSLKLRETKPQVRVNNMRLNNQLSLLSLQEFLVWNQQQWQQGKRYDVYMELKHPTFFRYEAGNFSADTAQLLQQQLVAHPLPAEQQLYVESFEAEPLQRWKQWRNQFRFKVTLVQLLGDVSGGSKLPQDNFAYPWDFVYKTQKQTANTSTILPTYADMVTEQGLKDIATYADAIGPWRDNLYPYAGGPVTPWVHQAKALGLMIHPYTFRAETEFRQKTPTGEVQSLCEELTWLWQQSWLDGIFTDNPDIAVQARDGKCPTK